MSEGLLVLAAVAVALIVAVAIAAALLVPTLQRALQVLS